MSFPHSHPAERRSGRYWVGALALTGLALVVTACGAGNAATQQATGAVAIGHAGTLVRGVFKWGEDSTGGMPYIARKGAANPNAADYGFEVDIALAMSKLMGITQQPTQITWSDWPQGLSSRQFDFFMNGLEISSENVKSAKFSIPYYVYTQAIVVLKDNSTISGFADLPGKKGETSTAHMAPIIFQNSTPPHPTHTHP